MTDMNLQNRVGPLRSRSTRPLVFDTTRHRHRGRKDVNWSSFIDYSTPPFPNDYQPIYIVTDVSYTISLFSYYQQMIPFYRIFPLHDIVEMVLSVTYGEDTPGLCDFFMMETERRLGPEIDFIDFDGLELFYEQLQITLDEEIGKKAPGFAQNFAYVFHRWIDPISICLCNNQELRRKAFMYPKY